MKEIIRAPLLANLLEVFPKKNHPQTLVASQVAYISVKTDCSLQDYKARKKERLQKKIATQLQQDIQKAEAGVAASAGAADLMQFLSGFSDKTPSKQQGKGSRFTHTSKLQFAQVGLLSLKCCRISPAGYLKRANSEG